MQPVICDETRPIVKKSYSGNFEKDFASLANCKSYKDEFTRAQRASHSAAEASSTNVFEEVEIRLIMKATLNQQCSSIGWGLVADVELCRKRDAIIILILEKLLFSLFLQILFANTNQQWILSHVLRQVYHIKNISVHLRAPSSQILTRLYLFCQPLGQTYSVQLH